jgi:predicted nicotinamide N-methyase
MKLAQRWIPGGWTEQTVVVAGRAFSLLVPAAPDDVLCFLEQHPEASETLGLDPYWAQLWPTSERLSESVAKAGWPPGQQVVELGCGIGLVGLAALAAGMHVTFTDYNPLAVELALENARRNGLGAQANGLVVDWRNPPEQPFDMILGSDLIYDRQLHVPLMQTIERLASDDATIWIADGGRSATEEFYAIASKRWRIDLLDLDNQLASAIRIGEYRRMICHLPRRT